MKSIKYKCTYPTKIAGIMSKKAPITKDKPGNTSLVV